MSLKKGRTSEDILEELKVLEKKLDEEDGLELAAELSSIRSNHDQNQGEGKRR